MKSSTPRSWPPKYKVLIFLALFVAITLAILWAVRHPKSVGIHQPLAQRGATPIQTNLVSQTPMTMKSPATRAGILPNYPDFQERPLPVGYENSLAQWTAADGKDTNVIRRLAHNHLEYDRMVEENSRIFKRQLVYLKQMPAAVFEQAKLTGQQVQQLTLPGIDGQELQFQIVKSQSNGSSRQGMFSGHLAGNADSLVTLAFEGGREAFTVLAPNENIFVVGEPRENGQVIVKAIDPNTWGIGPTQGDDTIKTGSARN